MKFWWWRWRCGDGVVATVVGWWLWWKYVAGVEGGCGCVNGGGRRLWGCQRWWKKVVAVVVVMVERCGSRLWR
ncbi:hypothetical protein Hdeb2414_s0036g00732131 [Helianthus debilis subsp. tardiflorus]